MSSTTSVSASLSALAPMSLASRTSSPSRNLYMSGHGVGLTMRDRIPIWPSSRASAVSEPQPSPSALICVDIATERPARSSCARRSMDSRRCWGTTRRSSTAFRASQLRMRSAIEEVDHESKGHPDDESLPRRRRKTGHHVSTNKNSENGHDWDQRRAERPRQVRRLVSQRYDAAAHDHEREQRTDRHQLTEDSDWEEAGDNASYGASQDRGDVRRPEA